MEPEFPLTGYNFHKYLNEESVLMKAAESAKKLTILKRMIDKQILNKREE
jgi:hypothetical protein